MEVKFTKAFAPSIVLSKTAKTKIDLYIEIADKEVGWYGLVERINDDTFYVHDVFMIEQEVNSATTEIDPMGLAKLKSTLWKQKIITPENQDKLGLYLWGHSHVNMTPTPSGQDNTQFETICKNSNPPFFIRLIENKKGDRTVVLFINNIPFFGAAYISDPLWMVERDAELDKLKADIKAEMKEKVKDKVTAYSTVYGQAYYGTSKSSKYSTTKSSRSKTYTAYDDDDYDDSIWGDIQSGSYYNTKEDYDWGKDPLVKDSGLKVTTTEDGVPELNQAENAGRSVGKVARNAGAGKQAPKVTPSSEKKIIKTHGATHNLFESAMSTAKKAIANAEAKLIAENESLINKYSTQADFPEGTDKHTDNPVPNGDSNINLS